MLEMFRLCALANVLFLIASPLLPCRSLASAFSTQSQSAQPRENVKDFSSVTVQQTSFKLDNKPIIKESWISFWKRPETATYTFEYEFNNLVLQPDDLDLPLKTSIPTTIVMLIHPIGIGIGKWYYQRLFKALMQERDQLKANQQPRRCIFLAPDLLASDSACHPSITTEHYEAKEPKIIPLLFIEDWSGQLLQLLREYEAQLIGDVSDPANFVDYCIVANGGCASIALEMATQLVSSNSTSISSSKLTHGKLKTVVLSAPPRVSGLLYRESPNVNKLQRTYNRILLGLPGRFFWWYALRNNGKFLQTFTEKNLVASADNLSPDWRSNCAETAKRFGQRSKYSTFAFLAGALQRNCLPYFEFLKGKGVNVNVIAPEDTRPNDAKSWLWQKRKSVVSVGSNTTQKERVGADVSRFLRKQGLGGTQVQVRGRRCLAHEDAPGYARALLDFIG